MCASPTKKIVFVVSSLDVGGIELYLLRFLQWAAGSLSAVVVCTKKEGGVLTGSYIAAGATVFYWRMPPYPNASHLRFMRYLQAESPDAVCDFTGMFGAWCLLVAKALRINKRIMFYRGAGFGYVNPNALKISYAKLLAKLGKAVATEVLSNSEHALDLFHPGWRSDKLIFRVVRNPVRQQVPGTGKVRTVRESLGIPDAALVVGHVGRYVPEKNQGMIIAVARRMLAAKKDVLFLLVGPGCEKLTGGGDGVPGNVILLGYQSDIPRALESMDIFMFPSLSEGMPNALLEAMGAGVPSIASDIPSIREIFPSRLAELLFDPSSVDDATEALERLFDPTYRAVVKEVQCCHVRTLYSEARRYGEFRSILLDD